MTSRVFVGNLDFNTTREEIQELFSQAGEINDLFLPIDHGTGRPRGFAFVEYASAEAASQAIERFNGKELGGRALRVNAAEERPRRSGGDRPPFDGGYGGYGSDRVGRRASAKPKGSRRNVRARKRGF